MDFEGEAEAPPPQQEQKQQQDSDAQREDVSGSVDLKEGGKIEDKRWAGNDGEAEAEEQRGSQQQEDIQTEGGVRQGGVDMEGGKDEADDCTTDSKSQGHQKHELNDSDQQQQQQEDEGQVEVSLCGEGVTASLRISCSVYCSEQQPLWPLGLHLLFFVAAAAAACVVDPLGRRR